jgi:uncharacterized protein YbjT (DUF2867 family)
VVGKHIVEACRQARHDVSVLSRRTGTDLTSSTDLERALDRVEVIVDASNTPSQSRAKASAFFTTVTGNLQRAGASAGVNRLITISIVNIDKVGGNPYYKAKLAQEAAALAGPLPVNIVRATQFHEFPVQVMQRFHLGRLAFMPHIKVQTVAARAVGEVVADVVLHPPAETTTDVAGPQVRDLCDLARAAAARLGRGNQIVGVPVPGRTGRSLRSGVLTPSGEARIGGPTFEEWLAGDDILSVGR